MTDRPFQIHILPGMPGTLVNRFRAYQKPPTRKEQAETLRRIKNLFGLSVAASQLSTSYSGLQGAQESLMADYNSWKYGPQMGGLGKYI